MWLHVPSTFLPSVPAPVALNSDSMPPSPEPELYVTSSGKPTPRPVSWRGWKTRPWIRNLIAARSFNEGYQGLEQELWRSLFGLRTAADQAQWNEAFATAVWASILLQGLSANSGSEVSGKEQGSAQPTKSEISGEGSGASDRRLRCEVCLLWRDTRRILGARPHQRRGSAREKKEILDIWRSIQSGYRSGIPVDLQAALPQLQLCNRLVWLLPPRARAQCGELVSVLGLADWNSVLESLSHDCGPSAMSNEKHTQPQRLSHASATASSMTHQFGTTLPPSTLNRGVDAWISSLRATRASQTASPDIERGRTTTGGSSIVSSKSSIKAGLILSSGKTSQGMRTDNYRSLSQHWSEWAASLRQEYSQRRKSAPAIEGRGCSSSPSDGTAWTTPCADDTGGRSKKYGQGGTALSMQAGMMWPTAQSFDATDLERSPEARARALKKGGCANLREIVKMWPTATVTSGDQTADNPTPGQTGGTTLGGAAKMWPTARSEDSESSGERKSRGVADTLTAASRQWATPKVVQGGPNPKAKGETGPDLQAQVKQWPTPAATEARNGYQNRHRGKKGTQKSLTTVVIESRFSPPAPQTPDGPQSSKSRRTLNPLFVEWLMGWPPNWSSASIGSGLQETAWCHWQQLMRTELSRLCSMKPEQASLF